MNDSADDELGITRSLSEEMQNLYWLRPMTQSWASFTGT